MAGRPTPDTFLPSQSFEGVREFGDQEESVVWEILTAHPQLTRRAEPTVTSRRVRGWRVAQPESRLLKARPQANVSHVTSAAKSRLDKPSSFLSPVGRKTIQKVCTQSPFSWNFRRQRGRVGMKRPRFWSQLSPSSCVTVGKSLPLSVSM